MATTLSPVSPARNFVPALLDWYRTHARDLPWRKTRDPYPIWISEIMLQQTQVKTVLPYWNRWMRALPTIESLARATSPRIHKLWEGLGYYTRVRNLQRAAQQILRVHGGKFPEQYDEILALPGIGRYTAGAICSIAFQQATPVVDGNVIRVLTRVFGIAGNPRDRVTNDQLWSLAQELVTQAARKSEPANWNQALMELGALVCTPANPQCKSCPVSSRCTAHRENRVAELPNLGPRTPPTRKRYAAFVLQSRGRIFVRRRPAGVVNAHLWEFPNVELTQRHATPRAAARHLLGPVRMDLKKLCAIRHSITRYRIVVEVFGVADGEMLQLPADSGQWLKPSRLVRLPFPSAHKRILQQALESRWFTHTGAIRVANENDQ